MSVFYDGEMLCVQLNRNVDYNVVLNIAKESEYSQYLQDIGIYCLPPTKRNARLLYEAGYLFDDSAKPFLRTSENKQEAVSSPIPKELYPFQKEGVETLLSSNRNYLLADEMGLGKTVQALVYLKLNPKSLPAVVICPASLKLNWAKEVEKWVGVTPYILSGRKCECLTDEFVKKFPIWIVNYDILGTENPDEKAQEAERKRFCEKNGMNYKKRKLKVYGWCDEICKHTFNTIICDEVQNIAEEETLRSRAVSQICNNPSRKIFLSGTPYETRTSQFFTCLHILDSQKFPNRWKYLMTYCNPKKTFFGWQFQGLSNGEQLHEKISSLMIRRLKKDVLTQLPPKNRIVVPMDITLNERRIYDECDRELQKAVDNHETNALTKLAKLKQASFDAKKRAMIQWIKDYLDINNKLVVFVYHKTAFHTLMDEFKDMVVGINGETPVNDRQKAVDLFQLNKKIKLFVGQIKSCNAGLTLTAANATCFVEFGTTCVMHEQAEDRVHRISQEADSVFAYYLILDDSIDNVVMDVLNSRNVDMKRVLNNEANGELFKKEEDFNDIILAKYAERKKITLK